MGTAIETRDVLSELDGVIRVHPNGLNGTTLVYVKDKQKVTQKVLEAALAKTAKLRLTKVTTIEDATVKDQEGTDKKGADKKVATEKAKG